MFAMVADLLFLKIPQRCCSRHDVEEFITRTHEPGARAIKNSCSLLQGVPGCEICHVRKQVVMTKQRQVFKRQKLVQFTSNIGSVGHTHTAHTVIGCGGYLSRTAGAMSIRLSVSVAGRGVLVIILQIPTS